METGHHRSHREEKTTMVWSRKKNAKGENNKLIMEWIPLKRRKRGRPRETWIEGVQEDLTTRNSNQINGETEKNGVWFPEVEDRFYKTGLIDNVIKININKIYVDRKEAFPYCQSVILPIHLFCLAVSSVRQQATYS